MSRHVAAYRKARAEGRCEDCNAPNTWRYARCDKCRAKNREYQYDYRIRKKHK